MPPLLIIKFRCKLPENRHFIQMSIFLIKLAFVGRKYKENILIDKVLPSMGGSIGGLFLLVKGYYA
jgi:hypothetical protein